MLLRVVVADPVASAAVVAVAVVVVVVVVVVVITVTAVTASAAASGLINGASSSARAHSMMDSSDGSGLLSSNSRSRRSAVSIFHTGG